FMIIYCCINCANQIDYRTALYGKGKCQECFYKFNKGINHFNYKHGLSNKPNFCLGCNILISWRALRCGSCNVKYCYQIGKLNRTGKNNPQYIDGRKNIT